MCLRRESTIFDELTDLTSKSNVNKENLSPKGGNRRSQNWYSSAISIVPIYVSLFNAVGQSRLHRLLRYQRNQVPSVHSPSVS